MIYQVPLTDGRREALRSGSAPARAASLERLGHLVRAAPSEHGPDWRDWPAELADPGARHAAEARRARRADARSSTPGCSGTADEQLAAAQQAAQGAGMAHGIIHDLAVGAHPGGADAWAHQDLLVARAVSVGAPPDGFNQLGQDWSQPPWNPQRLAAAGYRPLAELFAAALRHAGGLRVDHVMGLMRLWWVPAGHAARPRRLRPLRPPGLGRRARRGGRRGPGRSRSARTSARSTRGSARYLAEQRHPRHDDAVVRARARRRAAAPRRTGAAAAWRRSARTTCRRSPAS